MKRISVLGVPFDVTDLDAAVDAVAGLVAARQFAQVVTANLDYLYQCGKDPYLAGLVARADLVVADGVPVLWMARWQRTPLPGRVNGTELVMLLLEEAAARSWRVSFVGGGPGVAEGAAVEARRRWGTDVVAAWGPPPEEMDDAAGASAIAQRVSGLDTDLLLLGIGGGRQERWVDRNRDGLGRTVVIGVGSALDFLAGTQRRAPEWMQRHGFEWAWRLALEPRRLARRYLVEDPQVLVRFAVGRLREGR